MRKVVRAKIVLMAGEGLSNSVIAERLDVHVDVVSRWRTRFCHRNVMTSHGPVIGGGAASERSWFQRFWAGLDKFECDGYSNRDEGAFAVADDESLTDVIAEFERASQRSRVIAYRFDLDETKDNPREGKVPRGWSRHAIGRAPLPTGGHTSRGFTPTCAGTPNQSAHV
jgi:hypothetical protein